MGSLLQEMFLRFGGAFKTWDGEEETEPVCSGPMTRAVEHVVYETYSRLRFLPGYSRRLMGPVATTFRYIDELVEEVPGSILCCRSSFSEDPRVNAFFVDPSHLQKVFSQSAQVRDLLDTDPGATEFWALLCMKKTERSHLGMSLVGDAVHKDVMQTAVSFTDHQVLSPACSEDDARRSLKCCIFNGLLAYIRKQASQAKTRAAVLETRHRSLVRRLSEALSGQSGESRQELQNRIDDVEQELTHEIPRLASLEDHLDLVADILGNPAQYLNGGLCSIRLSRLGIKLDGDRADTGNEIQLFEIQVASQQPRVGALVRFPRAELLPQRDFIREADLFLAL